MTEKKSDKQELEYLNNCFKQKKDYLNINLGRLEMLEKKSGTLSRNHSLKKPIIYINPLESIEGKNVLIFDTETTGLPIRKPGLKFIGRAEYYDYRDNEKYDSSRIVQIGWISIDKFNWNDVSKYTEIKEYIRKPIDFNDIPCVTVKIHGIDFEKASNEGIIFEDIINNYYLGEAILKADYIIAHNAYFDIMILLNELYRCKLIKLINKINDLHNNNKIICTGDVGKNVLKTGICYPNLVKLYKNYYFVDPKHSHNAADDVKTLLDILPYLAQKKYKNKSIMDMYLK